MKKFYKSLASIAISMLLITIIAPAKALAAGTNTTEHGKAPTNTPKIYGGLGTGDNLDGSDCMDGTTYNQAAGGCLYPEEIGCSGFNPCANGQICVKAEDYPAVTRIDKGDAGIGICIVSQSISSDSNPLSMAMCSFYNFLTGSTGRILIALVVVSIGITFLFGKVEFKTLLNVLLGTAVIFGAPFMVKVFLGSGFEC